VIWSLIPWRYAALAGAVLAISGTAWGAVALHDRAVRAEQVAEQAAEQAKADLAQQQRIVAALGRQIADRAARAAETQQIKEDIGHAIDTDACAGSEPVTAALHGLHIPAVGATGGHP
jgi:hypothetical protein